MTAHLPSDGYLYLISKKKGHIQTDNTRGRYCSALGQVGWTDILTPCQIGDGARR